MARFACLLISDIALAAALRAEPALRGKPLAIVEGNEIVAGWMRGLSPAQARTVEPSIEIRPLSLEGVRAAREALCDAALSAGPCIMEERAGLVFLDLDGLQALFPTERGLLTALEKRLGEVGLHHTRLGIGPTRTASELAARYRDGGQILHSSTLTQFLSPLPLDFLEPSDELVDRLWRWGIRTLGQLSRVRLQALGGRLGEAGVRLAKRARGQDLQPFRSVQPPLHFEEPVEFGFAVDNLETLTFLLRAPLERLTRRLRLRGFAARQLWLEFVLENGSTCAREIPFAAPTLEVSVILSLVRLQLEREPLSEPTERAQIIATPGSVETAQLDLFRPPLPAPSELAMTVARIEALVGNDGVTAPFVPDSHLPNASGTQAFRFRPDTTQARAVCNTKLLARAAMAQRVLRPPRPVQVKGREAPEHIVPFHSQCEISGGSVLNRAGPWRFFGEWWGETRFARDYYDVELSDGGVYRLYHNLEDDSWFIDGIYD